MDHSQMKLGKRSVRHDPRVRAMVSYLPSTLGAPPDLVNWAHGIKDWGMMRNDEIGDCTAAAVAHLEQAHTVNTRTEWTAADAQVVQFYSDTTGYDPKDPSTDQGGVEVDVLTYWLKHDFCKRKIVGFSAINPSRTDAVKHGIHLFGGLYTGVQLPLSAQDQDVWDVPPRGAFGDGKPGSWGGHAIYCVAYDKDGVTCVTWGALKRMTWRFWQTYMDEAYAVLTGAWIDNKGVSTSGFDLKTLEQHMQELRAA